MDFPLVNKNSKIVVAMSGGVDSSTVAALLKSYGFNNLVGITLRLYDNDEAKGISCKDTTFKHDAENVAAKIGIEHKVLDLRERFYDLVINPFINSYLEGNTPSPCTTCNREIKFGALLEEAKKLNAEILVTGHYIKWELNNGLPVICMNQESIRDQSYFLAKIKKDSLKMIRFPLANMKKSEVRGLAENFGLHVAQKPSSNDICFAGGKNYSNLIKKSSKTIQTGSILDINGNVVGEHNGIFNYTIGQRKGIGVSNKDPLYVVNIDSKNNTVTVASREYLAKKEIVISNVNWLGEGEFSQDVRKLDVKVRASQQLVSSVVEPLENNKARVVFGSEVFGVAPGQICAFYKENRLLGGGDI